jgi:hypothetical protein
LLYNRARFGSGLEFGQTYILGAYNHPQLALFSLGYLPSHLFVHLLSPPSIDLDFPFFHLYPAVFPDLPHSAQYFDSISGLLPCVPLAGLAFLSPLLLLPVFRAAIPRLYARVAIAFAVLGLLILLFICCYLGSSARYFADFCPPLLLSAALAWIALDRWLAERRAARWSLNAACGLLLAYGTVVNLAVGLTGYYDLFRKSNPDGYYAIADRFLPLQRVLLRLGPPHGDMDLRLRLPALTVAMPATASPPEAQALVSVGTWRGADRLCLRYRDEHQVVFRFHHGDETVRSRAVPISRGETHRLEISMGSLLPHLNPRALSILFPGSDPARLSVRLDGEEVLSGSFDFEPVDPFRVAIGRNAGGGDCPAGFTGEILEVRRGPREAGAGP